MRRRCRGASGDSLELLLDTICNTFGGIVFIALLIVLLLRETGSQREEPAEVTSPEQLEGLATRLRETTAELAALRTARSDLAQRAAEYAPAATRELLKRRGELESQAAELRSTRDAKIAENAAASAAVARTEAELDRLGEELSEENRRVAALEDELGGVKRSRAEEIRNPVVREAAAFRNVGLVVRYGRMYVWHRYDAAGFRAGLNTDEFVIVETRDGAAVTRPDPTKGIPLDSPDASTRILGRFRSFSPRTHYFEVVVRPDSFEQFQVLRDTLLQAGYEYRLMPTEVPVTDRGGSDGKVQ